MCQLGGAKLQGRGRDRRGQPMDWIFGELVSDRAICQVPFGGLWQAPDEDVCA